jgi:hypothetical protein
MKINVMKTSKTKYILSLSILIMLVAGFYINQNRYVKLEPLAFNGEELYEIYFKPEEIKKFQIILANYEEPYKIDDGEIYIKNSLSQDEQLVWNYTTKALRLP